MNTTTNITDFFGPVISSYSRAQAIEDGYLADISEQAKEAGIKFPVALSSGIVGIIEKAVKGGKDWTGVIWDILTMLRYGIRQSSGDRINFIVRIGRANVTMYALCSPGDTPEPVITIMLPNED